MSRTAKRYSWTVKAFISLTIMERLFGLLHWPYANYIALAAAVIIIIFYPLRYIDKSNKELLDHVKVAIALMIGANTLFHLEHLMYIQGAILVLFSYWFLNEGLFYLKIRLDFWNKKEHDKKILDDFGTKKPPYNFTVDILISAAILLLIIGASFKLMHWPGANAMLLIGASLLSVMIWFKEI